MQLQVIQNKIYEIRGQKIIFDFDLSEMYGVQNRSLKQSVKRNLDRFPADFMFTLTRKEWLEVITNCDNLPEKIKYSPTPPFAFTEQGVAMLASILNSKKAIKVNIDIVRVFVLIRQFALSHEELSRKIKSIERKYNRKFRDVYSALKFILQKDKQKVRGKVRKKIGFIS